ncbi:EpsG family protein [Alistipes onderdonkii]|mgnify:FL=1|jgi:hypothetical protein|uniref:EpsG family protein n=1 Tax=Alistipes onderdonkii TaxID=328813 RepID=UPI001EE0996B|nr:EpsG family protein [Alistipes onderdonkii]MCG4861671.1 EpsG family protein [Alistipes onderdonkii]
MEFYIYLALIVLLLSLVKGTDNKVVYIGVAFALFFLAAYRSLGVGTDSEAYYTIYYQYANNDAYVAASDNYKTAEFIWLAMLRYFRNADNYRGLLVMLAALNAIPLFYALKKQSKWPLFSVFLYIALYFYGNSLNTMRQYAAMSFLLLAIPFLKKGKNKYYLLLMLLATAIHMSALFVFILVWSIYKANLNFDNKLRYSLIIAVSFIIGMFFTAKFKEALEPIANLFASSNYEYYLSGDTVNESRNLLSNLGFNLIAIFMLYINKDANNIYFKLYILGVIMVNLLAGLGAFSGRVASYFSLMQIVAIPNLLYLIKKSLQKYLYIVIFIVYGLSIYIYYLSKNLSEIVPYSNIFFN